MKGIKKKRDPGGLSPEQGGANRKAAVYESLSGMNQTFEQMLGHAETLVSLGMLRRAHLYGWRNRAEELRAEMNRSLTGTLHAHEEREWARFGRRTRAEGKKK
jgi:hypothetical protein